MANTIKLYHEKRSSGNYVQHIEINGIELSGRTISNGDNVQLYNEFISFLNDKAQEELSRNPRFAWTNLKDFRSWATSHIKEYNKFSEKELANKITKSIDDNNPDK